MKSFKMTEEDMSEDIEYYVLRCSKCGALLRHDIKLGAFGKPMKNRMCQICGEKIPIDDEHALTEDPLQGMYSVDFKSAKDL